jgi:hypothetical protein
MTKTQQTRRENFARVLKRFEPHMCQQKELRPNEQVPRWAVVSRLYGEVAYPGHFVRLFDSRPAALEYVTAPARSLSPGAKSKYVALVDLSKGTVESLKLPKPVKPLVKVSPARPLAA